MTVKRKPWTNTKAARRILSPDEHWAAEIREQVLADAHPWQADAVMDPHRFATWLCGRGAGKTTAHKARYVISMAATPKGRYLFVAPTLGMATELLWDPLKDTCEKLRIEADFKEIGKTCTFRRNGARLRLAGADDRREIDKFRGQPFDGVGADEVALWPIDLVEIFIDRVIVPRLGERDGWMALASTPGHVLRGIFYESTRPGSDLHRPYADRDQPQFAGWNRWSSHAWNLKDIAELPEAMERFPAICANWREALATKERNGWGDDHPVWLREHLGRWAADNTTMVFSGYHPERNQWDPYGQHRLEGITSLTTAISKLPKEHTWHFVIAQDMGHSDPYACGVFAFTPSDATRTIWHVFDYERVGMYMKLIAELLIGADLNHTKLGGVLGVIGWPDGMIMDADQAHIEELANVYGVRVVKAERKPDYKMGAIELVNGDLIEGRIKIIKGSVLERELQELQWQESDSGQLRENRAQANHATDCLVYARKLIAKLFDSGVVTHEATAVKPAYADPMGLSSGEPAGEFDAVLADAEYSDWG